MKCSNEGIQASIEEAFKKHQIGDLRNMAIQVFLAIDATAKKMYPNIKSTQRVKKIINDNRDFIYKVSTNGVVSCSGQIYYMIDGKSYDLGEVVWKIRCDLIHEAQIGKKFSFYKGAAIGVFVGHIGATDVIDRHYTWKIGSSSLLALLLVCVGMSVNRGCKIGEQFTICYFENEKGINDLFGDLSGIKNMIQRPTPPSLQINSNWTALLHNQIFKIFSTLQFGKYIKTL